MVAINGKILLKNMKDCGAVGMRKNNERLDKSR